MLGTGWQSGLITLHFKPSNSRTIDVNILACVKTSDYMQPIIFMKFDSHSYSSLGQCQGQSQGQHRIFLKPFIITFVLFTVEEARSNNKVVLVHCMAGISRSVTITIAYLMKFHRMSTTRAYQYLKDMRPAISPNLNFMGQLIEFERSLELGNDQHSPQVMSSDPMVATTTASPAPSKVRQLNQGSVYLWLWFWRGRVEIWQKKYS